MVVTRLWEVTSKGKEALSGASTSSGAISNPNSPVRRRPREDSFAGITEDESSYWNSALNSIQSAATSVSGKVSSLFGTDSPSSKEVDEEAPPFYSSYNPLSIFAGAAAAPIITSRLKAIGEFDDDDDDDDEDPILGTLQTPSRIPHRRSLTASPWSKTPHADLVWMFRHNKNPYSAVRGRDTQPSSMTAVRSLVALVPTSDSERASLRRESSHGLSSQLGDVSEVDYSPDTSWSKSKLSVVEDPEDLRASPPSIPPPPYEFGRQRTRSDHSATAHNKSKGRRKAVSASETASQLAEGTIRALRDLALDEAVELQTALRYWNDRWERPLLSWLEAGPLGTSPLAVRRFRFLCIRVLILPCIVHRFSSMDFSSRLQSPGSW